MFLAFAKANGIYKQDSIIMQELNFLLANYGNPKLGDKSVWLAFLILLLQYEKILLDYANGSSSLTFPKVAHQLLLENSQTNVYISSYHWSLATGIKRHAITEVWMHNNQFHGGQITICQSGQITLDLSS